ncbi:hypothetical protein [uncultured phage cr60_1]|uniref:Uncharacterized protein n=1 Tax=uncultured phage cr60_1 TaxID=2772082 RepID=A0A7M1RSZ1_9CAUD|nr:hypothetical protein KNV49_gp75 [uncultured phage cr60_1]QOR56922.1 hypothetical protein [uncultured phage cr60_1]
MKYTFRKDFGIFKANDTLTWDGELKAFTMDVKEGDSFRSAMIDGNTVKDMCNEGLLKEDSDQKEDKINSTVEFIDNLLDQYEKDYKEVMDKYNEGNIQPCVKVEAETVYYNLTKVLNKVREELTNE